MKLLITGALGHIGSKLIRNLSHKVAHEVVLLDNLESQRYPSLFDLPKDFRFKFIQADLLTADLNSYLSGVDILIHLAATPYKDDQKFPEHIQKKNSLKLKRVADACLANNVKLFFPSTTSVYSGQAANIDETCTQIEPQSPYAEAKYHCEKYLEKLGRQGLKYTICRFGTIFGYSIGMRFDTAVNKFIWQAANREPITVWKTALNQKRAYLYLGDCIKAINLIIESDLFNGQTYNVLTENLTVKDIVEAIKQLLPQLKVTYVDSPIMNSLSYATSDQKFRLLGFKPLGEIRAGIKETVDQLKGIINTQ